MLKQNSPYLRSWQEAGMAGEMKFMLRNFSDLNHILPEAKSVVQFLVPYSREFEESDGSFEPKVGYGRIARYAWGRDYHEVLREKLKDFVQTIATKCFQGEVPKFRVFSDSVPFLERGVGANAALGFIGRNSMLIRPGIGSYTFIAEIMWDVEIDGIAAVEQKSDLGHPGSGCGGCQRCLPACPTGAIVKDGVIDARKCISYLTIEKRDYFTAEEATQVGDWIFGCDICQEVCPFNVAPKEHKVIKEFKPSVGVGPYFSLLEGLEIKSEAEFRARFKGTALLRVKRAQFLRNVCMVIANTKFLQASTRLLKLATEDSDEYVRFHAQLALSQLRL